MALKNIPSLELPSTEAARVGRADAALIPLVADQGGLVQVGPPAPRAAVLVGCGVAWVQRRLLVRHVGARHGGLVHQLREEGTLSWNTGVKEVEEGRLGGAGSYIVMLYSTYSV